MVMVVVVVVMLFGHISWIINIDLTYNLLADGMNSAVIMKI